MVVQLDPFAVLRISVQAFDVVRGTFLYFDPWTRARVQPAAVVQIHPLYKIRAEGRASLL
jgi:hypothetical protein